MRKQKSRSPCFDWRRIQRGPETRLANITGVSQSLFRLEKDSKGSKNSQVPNEGIVVVLV